MKYMGSKRAMLRNGLGEAISKEISGSAAFFDLFSGSAAVAWHVAEKYRHRVFASDLQEYSAAMASSVLGRTAPITDQSWINRWVACATEDLGQSPSLSDATKIQADLRERPVRELAEDSRHLSSTSVAGSITLAYGGYYFSPLQALWIDALRRNLPQQAEHRQIALAALVVAGSQCAASPGHTAQPFKPNDTAGRFLLEAWSRSVTDLASRSAREIGGRFSLVAGAAHKKDALETAKNLKEGDLAFIDPPYSGVHYSRFYHVLESIAVGIVGEVSGSGRYPSRIDRPSSDYSISTKAASAIELLLSEIASKGARAIVTFPAGDASNGLSGSGIREIAAKHFRIKEAKISSRFSTLGGNSTHRAARQIADELILTLTAK